MGPASATDIFRAEARDLLERLEAALLDLETRPGDGELINTAFRALHTLKGSGAMFGPPDMAAFAHRVEDAFERIRRGEAPLTPRRVGLLLSCADEMRHLLFDTGERSCEARAALLAGLEAELGEGAGAAASLEPLPQAPVETLRRFRITLALPPKALGFGTDPLGLLDELRALGSAEVTLVADDLPELDRLDPCELRLSWRVTLTTAAGRAAIEDVFIFVDEPGSVAIEEDEPPAARAEPAAEPEARPNPVASPVPAKAPAFERNMRVSAARLDTLLDQVGELVIAQTRLAALARTRRDPLLAEAVEEIERLSNDLRESAMDMRMLPISLLFSRYRRVVRDLSAELGKTVDFTLSGEETELDKTVLDRLGEPLVHIIRNGIDHGIEPEAARLAAGKPARGSLRLSARPSGTDVVITIEDDGAGLDRARILRSARAAGIVPDGAMPSDREIDGLIFHPGLSTADAVSRLSGRGVGMDAVKRAIEDLHGSIEIETLAGRGTRFVLRLPLTLAIVDGLLVRVGETRCILPLSGVEACVDMSEIEGAVSGSRTFVDIRGALTPLVRLGPLFGGAAGEAGIVVVAASRAGRIGIVVDEVIGQHQTVIKPLSPLHRRMPGLAGATILGDGSVALVLDVHPLVREAGLARPGRIAA